MKTVQQLAEEIKAKAKSFEALKNKAEADQTDDDLDQMEKLAEEIRVLRAEKDKLERRSRLISDVDDASRDLEQSRGRRSSPQTTVPAEPKSEPEFAKDPKKGFKSHIEFLGAVMAQGSKIEIRDPRLRYLYSEGTERMAAAGSDESGAYTNPNGGFLLPTGLVPGVQQISVDPDPITPRCQPVPMATDSVEINARVDKDHRTSVSGGLQVYRRAETQQVTAKRPSTKLLKLEAYELMGVSFSSQKLMRFSPISFAALLATGFRDEFAAKSIDEHLYGTGVGMHLGVMNSPCKIAVPAEEGQDANTINDQNLINMRARCWGYGSSIWLANEDCIPQLYQINQGLESAPLWIQSVREDIPDMLFGRPLIFTEHCETVGTEGDIVLGNWSQYLEGELMPLESEESTHVRFLENELAFKFWKMNAGMPWWDDTLIPRKSTMTRSPFVTLATRP